MLKKSVFYTMMSLSAVVLLCGCWKEKASEDTGQQLSIVSMDSESQSEETEEDGQNSVSDSSAPVDSDETEGKEEASKEQVAESTNSGSDVVAKFECEEMDFTLQINDEMKEIMEKLKYEYHEKQESDMFQTTCDSCDFYVMFGKTKQVMFSVYRMPEEYTIEDFSQMDCDVQMIGYSSAKETYVLQFPLEPKEELSEKEKEEFYSMMNDKLRNISSFIMLES